MSSVWFQIRAPSIGYATVLAAILALTASSSVTSQRGNVSASNVDVSSVGGGLVNLTSASSGNGFTNVTADGRKKTTGATSAGADDSNTPVADILSSTDPPVVNPPESEPTAGVLAPPVVSSPDATAPPGSAGELS